MATMELRRVPYGTTFTVFGDEFVALDYINGGVLAIRRDIWKDAPFDREGVNDLTNRSYNTTFPATCQVKTERSRTWITLRPSFS